MFPVLNKYNTSVWGREGNFELCFLEKRQSFIISSNMFAGITLSCMINSTALALEAEHEESLKADDPLNGLLLKNVSSDSCTRVEGAKVIDYGGSYEWSVEIQGYIVGAAFLGGMLSVFPSGMAIDHFSMRHLLLLSVLLLSTVSVLVPLFAETMGPIAVMVLRFLMGVGEGMMIPGINGMITGWIPLHEKSTAAALYTSGNQLAGIISNPVAAEFCASTLRWPAVFYSSANSKWISDHEVKYLQHHLPKKHVKSEKKVIPWHAMARSAPLLVVFYSGIIGNMMIAMILVYIPVYFKDVLLLEVKQASSKAMLTLSICFLGLAYGVDCSTHGLALFLLCTIGAAFGLSISGFLTSLLSLSPNFIGILSSTSQIIGFGGRVATPMIITFFKTVGTAEEWRGILLVYSAMTIISAVLFFLWGSGDVQPWDSYRVTQSGSKDPPIDSKPLVDQHMLPVIAEA
ncbi:hypothetical protein GCK32_007931 [Trichostrongylus colubriformis]|uniref:Major facilitator superfamily (MFS) profile domain-containing protein n=1 Tax=Trichostrongylus colubriformis TaxID=6319 RepID=A0AAN8FDT1_TRICO